MTTVVYRDGIVAADQRGMSNGWIMPSREEKIMRLDDGRVLSGCGSTAGIAVLMAWVLGDRTTPQPKDDCAVILFDGGAPEVFELGGSYREGEARFYAWGSGMPTALGALYAGASAVEAIECAAKVDPNTGGDVQFMAVRT